MYRWTKRRANTEIVVRARTTVMAVDIPFPQPVLHQVVSGA
jgi:hypothetical protein